MAGYNVNFIIIITITHVRALFQNNAKQDCGSHDPLHFGYNTTLFSRNGRQRTPASPHNLLLTKIQMVFHRVVQHFEQFHDVRVVQLLQYRDLPVHPVQGIHRRLDPVGCRSPCNNTVMVIFSHSLGMYMQIWNSSFLLLQHFGPLLQ